MSEETYVCCTCKKELSLEKFSKHSRAVNGHSGKCKTCTNLYNKEWEMLRRTDPAWCKRHNARKRAAARRADLKKKRPAHKSHKDSVIRHYKRFPEKGAARNATRVFKKTKDVALHHWSYLKQHRLDVIELTRAEHVLAHRHMIYDQERMMYRKPDGTLIDSREAALAYYATLKDDTPSNPVATII